MARAKQAPPPTEEVLAVHESHRQPRIVRNLYRVIGTHSVFGAVPGTEIELLLTPGELAVLIGAGHIVPVESSDVGKD